MDKINFERDTWKIIDTYFNDNKYFLTNHQIDSFNDFISSKIPLTIKQYNPLIIYKDQKPDGSYKYEIHIYLGGYDGEQINISKPVIYDENNSYILSGEDKQMIKGSKIKQMYPNEARLKNLTYSSSLNCNVDIDYFIKGSSEDKNKISVHLENINIGKIPIMLHSNYCILNNQPKKMLEEMGESPYEQGGYFIVKGKEKVVLSQERMAMNKLYLAKKNSDSVYSYVVEIKSVPEKTFQPAKSNGVKIVESDNTIVVSIPNIKKNIPLFILFRALGLETDKEIIEYIFPEIDESQNLIDKLRPSINDSGPIFNQIDAINYLSTLTRFRTVEQLQFILQTDFLPHIDNQKSKIFYLGYMTNQLLKLSHGLIKPTDRDSFSFKRIDLSGFLLAGLFREYYEDFQFQCSRAFDKQYNENKVLYQNENISNIINISNRYKFFNPNIIENGFMKAMRGNWGIKNDPAKQGLVQDLSRLSFLGSISHLRRVNLPMVRNTKLVPPRRLHPSTWGIMCPVETPDGGNIGCIKHFSISAQVSFGSSSKPVLEAIQDNGLIPITQIIPKQIIGNTKVFVNGNWVGIHKEADKLVKKLKLLRRNACIHPYTSIIWNIKDYSLEVNTDTGRCIRPLYVVRDKNLLLNKEILTQLEEDKINWNTLLKGQLNKRSIGEYDEKYICPFTDLDIPNKKDPYELMEEKGGIIEYLDVEESENCLIATNERQLTESSLNPYTHCEIHSSLILGVMGLIIPFVEHNQAPRNLFSAGQSKQSVGLYASNYRYRLDQAAYLLSYPQRPLITTRMMKYIAQEKLPYGENAIVAIASYSGYNQEDALIFNKTSLQRGIFRTTYFRTYTEKEEINQITGENSQFINPIDVNAKRLKVGKNYNLLNKEGMPQINDYVTDNDIIIGKINKVEGENGEYYIDSSITPKKNTHGFVERVFVDKDEDNLQVGKVCIREERIPEIGDKFSSRAGQKGTIGMILNQEDMPFTKDGIVPDLIVNPHAIPSRMTIGQLIECVFGKVASVEGFIADASPFTNAEHPIETIGDYLEDYCHFERNGNEIMYNGMNGKQLDCSIFIGPTYYMRLKHLVHDKAHSRAQGPKANLTQQPSAGRARDGGLRVGEMERDAILSHGITEFLRESFDERADGYFINVSKQTGRIVPVNKNKNIYPEEGYSTIKVPYAFKLLMQEMESMSITPRLITD